MANIGIKELAKHLNISTASVSRALSNPERVSHNMRERVQKAAKELSYRPNKMGASLRTSRSGNILAIIPDLSHSFNSDLIHSIETRAEKYGYSVLFGDSQGLRERELRYGDLVHHKQADGVIFFSATPPFHEDLLNADNFELPPMVNSCEVIDPKGYAVQGKRIPFVTIDNVAAAEELVEHLISLEHQRIAVITGDMNSPSSLQRLQGYRQAHEKAGLVVDESLIFKGDFSLVAGEELANGILQLQDRPTAIFCMCDESAMGCLYTLKSHNIRVPEDISICGFDNIRFSKFSMPALTTVDQLAHQIGSRCVDLLIGQINGTINADESQNRSFLPHKLIIRESTARLVT
jgi:LacI family repressor for deo operon, udp, cdd, tsx, nupC, and nupG